jgi:hypothetical protein
LAKVLCHFPSTGHCVPKLEAIIKLEQGAEPWMGEEPQDQSLVGESACLHREAGKSRAKLVWALLSCSQQCSQPLHLRTAALMQCISALCSLHSGSCVNPPALHFLRCSKTPFTLALRISAWFVSLSF